MNKQTVYINNGHIKLEALKGVEKLESVYVLTEEELKEVLRRHTGHIMFKMDSVRNGGYSSSDDIDFITNYNNKIL